MEPARRGMPEIWRNKYKRYHRLDGPAIIYANGEQHWYKHGQSHRIDGPASIYENGDGFWYKNNNYHRLDGPAYFNYNGEECWYVNGVNYKKEQYFAHVAILQRFIKHARAHMLVKLMTKNRQAIELFYSPDGIGGKWHKKSMEMMFGIT